MSKYPFRAITNSRFSAKQRRALNAIGAAFETHTISFDEAVKLRDLVRAGHVDEVLERLALESAHNQNQN